MPNPLPIKTLPSFLYSSESALIIDAAPDPSISGNDIELGLIVAISDAFVGTNGYWQPSTGEARTLYVKPHDPTYTSPENSKIVGITVLRNPFEHMYNNTTTGALDIEDREVLVDTLDGPMRRLSIAVNNAVVLVQFVEHDGTPASLQKTDIGNIAIASVTNDQVGCVGVAGKAFKTDPGVGNNAYSLGRIVAVPVIGGDKAYVLLK